MVRPDGEFGRLEGGLGWVGNDSAGWEAVSARLEADLGHR